MHRLVFAVESYCISVLKAVAIDRALPFLSFTESASVIPCSCTNQRSFDCILCTCCGSIMFLLFSL